MLLPRPTRMLLDEAFAFEEGEDDRTLASWRREHELYFRRNDQFAPDMLLYCERFRLVQILDGGDAR